MSLWLFRHRIFVPVLNVSDVPPCGIVGFSEVEILVRFNTLWPSKGYVPGASMSTTICVAPLTCICAVCYKECLFNRPYVPGASMSTTICVAPLTCIALDAVIWVSPITKPK